MDQKIIVVSFYQMMMEEGIIVVKINIVKMTEWKNLYPIKKIILLSVWLFTVLILYASFVALIKDHDFRTIFIIILDSVGLVKSFIPIKNIF